MLGRFLELVSAHDVGWRVLQDFHRNLGEEQDEESSAEIFSDPARHGELRTREAVLPLPSKPSDVELDVGHLHKACSHPSHGSSKLQETILVVLGHYCDSCSLPSPLPSS